MSCSDQLQLQDEKHEAEENLGDEQKMEEESEDTEGTEDTEETVPVLKHIPKRSVPNSDVPERIIVCVDCCQGSQLPTSLRAAISFFLHAKLAIDPSTRFALVALEKSQPSWRHPFTDEVDDIMCSLDACESERCEEAHFDLSALADLILSEVDLPEMRRDYKLAPPPYAVRALLVYGRPRCVPSLASDRTTFEALSKHPYFTFDALYSHDEEERPEIFDGLQSLDNGYSYMFAAPVIGNKLLECGAKLLAHPLQRPLQRDARYNFN